MSAKNVDAVEAMVQDNPVLQRAESGPLVQLAMTLAAQMDAAGADPSTRLSAAYLSVLKDLSRAIRQNTSVGSSTGKLAKFRAINGFKTG